HLPVSILLSVRSPPPSVPPFPTRRSSDLVVFWSADLQTYPQSARPHERARRRHSDAQPDQNLSRLLGPAEGEGAQGSRPGGPARDRKSTRLNSSHVKSSYAVFCLKKKSRS